MGRTMASAQMLFLFTVILTTKSAMPELASAVLPPVPPAVEANAKHAKIGEFVKLWKEALEIDGEDPGPAVRLNFEVRTVAAPDDFHMLNAVPQHVRNPLYIRNATFAKLRKEFLLDHIFIDALELNAPELTAPSGLRTASFSGKDVVLRFDEKLGLVADGVRVTAAMTLQDGTRMLTLNGFLFGARQRINSALDDILGRSRSADLDTPLGPPLDLSISLPQPPAPPPVEELARGTQGFVIQTPSRLVSLPALPPAPPPGFASQAASSSSAGSLVPSQSSSTFGVQPPATESSARFFPQPPAPPPSFSVQPQASQASLTSPALPSQQPTSSSFVSSGKNLVSSTAGLQQSIEQRLNTFDGLKVTSDNFSPGLDISKQNSQLQQTHSGKAQSVGIPLPQGPGQLGSSNGRPNTFEIGQQLNAFHSSQSLEISPSSATTNAQADHASQTKFHSKGHSATQSGHGIQSPGNSRFNDVKSSQISFKTGRQQTDQVGVPLPGLEGATGQVLNNDFQLPSVGSNLLNPISGDPALESLDNRLDTIEDILERENLDSTLEILRETNFLEQLLDEESGTFLLLAPSNEALTRLSDDELDDLKSSDLFSYHIIPLGDMPAPEVTNDSTFTTLLGKPVRFNVYDGKVFVNGLGLVRGDIPVPRGTIQVVDGVLRPPAGDLQTVLERAEAQVTRTAALLTMHSRTLSQDRPITVLAPLDASITSKGFSWPGLLESSEMAESLLGGLTIEGTWYAEGLTRQRTLTSAVGMNITFRKMADGTVTANGVPLIMSDLSAVDGVAHVVADLIPNTDLGSDSSDSQTPIFEIIKEGAIKNAPDNFSGVQNFIANSDPPTFKSVVDSGAQQRSDPSTGNGIINGIPQISGLYQTPVENNFDFNQPPPVFSPEEPFGTSDGEQDIPSYNVIAPVDSVSSLAPDYDTTVDEQDDSILESQGPLLDTFPIDSTVNQEADPDVPLPSDIGVPLPSIPAIDATSVDSTINAPDDSGVLILDGEVSPTDTSADSSQVPLSNVGPISTDGLPPPEYSYTTPHSEGLPLPEATPEAQSPVLATGSFSEDGVPDLSPFPDVGVPLPEAESGVQIPESPFDSVDSTVSGDSTVGVDFSETDFDGGQIPVNEVNVNISPEIDPRPTIADSIAQFDQSQDTSSGAAVSEGDYSLTENGASTSSVPTGVSTDEGSSAPALGTETFEPEFIPSLSESDPTPQDAVSSANAGSSSIASNDPSVLTLYNTPNLSSDERTDPFISAVPTDFLRSQPSSSSIAEGFTSQSSARSFSSGSRAAGVNNIFISTPDVIPGQTNPFDLSARTKSNSFDFKTEVQPLEIVSVDDDHDSFFVITRGNLNLKDVISELDENIRKHIHILDSPSIFFNSSVTKLALQKSLPEQLLEEIRQTLNANNMTFENIGASPPKKPSTHLSHPQISKTQAVPARDDSIGLALHNSGSTFSVESKHKSSKVDSTSRISSAANFGKTGIISRKNLTSNVSSNEIFAPRETFRTNLPSSGAQQTLQPLRGRPTTPRSPNTSRVRFSSTTSQSPNPSPLTTITQDPLELEATTTEFFDVETTTVSQKTQKSLEPVSGLINLLNLQQNKKPLQDEKFPIVSVTDAAFASTTPGFFERTTEQPTEFATDASTVGDFEETFVNTELPGQDRDVPSSTGGPISLTISTDDSEATIQTAKATFAQQLQRDDSISASLEQEINVIDFLREKNLTAFADLLVLTGLNRDLIRGGPWTIFAPSNEGIEIVRLSGGLDLSMKDLRHLAAYHVVPRVLTADVFIEKSRLPTLYAGYTLYMESNDNERWSAGGGLLTGSSWVHSGPSTWVTHEVDRVLYAPHGNLLTTMALAPALTNFTTLLAANPRIRTMLQGRQPITVVAPSNAAMARLPPGVQPSSAWLESHITRGFRYSVCFPRHSALPTLAGTQIQTSTNATNGVVSINGTPASYLDITAANGVLHVVDDLIVTGS